MDFITFIPKTDCSVDTIATFIDCLPKYTYFVPDITSISTDDLAQVFLSTVVAQHGVPEHLILDHDSHFVSAFQKGLTSVLRTQVALSTASYPQMDRQLERQDCSLE